LRASKVTYRPEEKTCVFKVSETRIFIKIYGPEWARREVAESFIMRNFIF
jgi:hypothetical protein